MDFTALFIVSVLIFFVFFHFKNTFLNVKYVRSQIDNRLYLVRNVEDKQKAADTLAKMSKKLEQLINHLVNNKPTDDKNRSEAIDRLKKNYNPDNISESTEFSKYTSYSVNKGEKIIFCIRSKDNNKIEKFNVLMFVAIHELGHLMSESVGHTEEFWDNFKYLLVEAVKINIYKKDDFNKIPEKYCGIEITDTPLND